MIRRPPEPTLFPYTTLSRSDVVAQVVHHRLAQLQREPHAELEGHLREHREGEESEHPPRRRGSVLGGNRPDRKSTRLNSSHANISYAVFCLKNKNIVCTSLL